MEEQSENYDAREANTSWYNDPGQDPRGSTGDDKSDRQCLICKENLQIIEYKLYHFQNMQGTNPTYQL